MPEARPSERRPIVPDPDSSLTRPRRPTTPPPRLWPLKFAVLLLLAALLAVSWLGWQERERLNAQLQQVSAEMSNVHARFDAEEGRGDRLETIESRLSSTEEHAESMVARMAGLEVEVQQVSEGEASRFEALDERVDEVSARLERFAEEAETREALLMAVRTSLDSLERAGAEGRETLEARIETVAAVNERQTQRIAEWQDQQEALAERQRACEHHSMSGSRPWMSTSSNCSRMRSRRSMSAGRLARSHWSGVSTIWRPSWKQSRSVTTPLRPLQACAAA
ncbi:MAG: hypothetical protein LPK08_09420 [Halomonas sp.]|nr:hypothetical protein [Halomonas sp.]MDX5503074.1 hypothetical protein [Halomonas sp.]